MSTRAQVRFATREEGVSFSKHPEKINAQFYKHHDGYPEGLGVDIAESLLYGKKIQGWEVESFDEKHSDLEYIYYIWQKGLSSWISIFEISWPWCECCENYTQKDTCIFVGKPSDLINKYKND